MKKYLYGGVLLTMSMTCMYYGQDIAGVFEDGTQNEPQVRVETQKVVVDEFEELVESYKQSEDGKEVLNTWATQKALDETRKKLDEIEKQTLTKEASL